MKIKFSEEPKEWRKTAWMTAVGLAVFTTLLRWRHVLPLAVCVVIWAAMAGALVAAAIEPRWFRGLYRFSMRLGFGMSQVAGRIVLAAFFVVILTPVGLVRRALGKDPLRLQRRAAESYWMAAPPKTPLDRLF
jgi:hypothetical protein